MSEMLEDYAPLSRWDEYPIHQAVSPIRYVQTIDPRAFERYWFTAQARDASFLLVTGMGFYPNLGTADGYALLVCDNRQTTLRAQRALSTERAHFTIGPVHAEPLKPFAEWRLQLGENSQSLRYDLRWRDTKRASFRKMDLKRRRRGLSTREMEDKGQTCRAMRPIVACTATPGLMRVMVGSRIDRRIRSRGHRTGAAPQSMGTWRSRSRLTK
ncbi:MAG: hypothetical protein EPO08_07300 [Rhodospirillaceae bacterium]|nr:MAG: hypothetical protein EPO08_07300 [Rhodospirillaceae bacterium]